MNMIFLLGFYTMAIGWCKKKGMKLTEPNDNLADEYYLKSSLARFSSWDDEYPAL